MNCNYKMRKDLDHEPNGLKTYKSFQNCSPDSICENKLVRLFNYSCKNTPAYSNKVVPDPMMIPTMIATPSRSPSSFFMWTD